MHREVSSPTKLQINRPRRPVRLDVALTSSSKRADGAALHLCPSHGIGKSRLVVPMARAAVADGLVIEVHDHPEHAVRDGAQRWKATLVEAGGPSTPRPFLCVPHSRWGKPYFAAMGRLPDGSGKLSRPSV
jgi:hypothetical protein